MSTQSTQNRLRRRLIDVRACQRCAAYLPLPPRPILQMHAAARILIISQAPGRRAHESGIPFDDPSGQRLREWLGMDGATFYDPQRVAILPMGFCFPGGGKSGDLPPRSECALAWRTELLSYLNNVELTLLVGKYALAHHLPGVYPSITAAVVDWQRRWPQQAVLPHPSPRNNLWLKRNPWFATDFLPHLQARVTAVLASPLNA